jgi:hypothetical protein
MSTWEYCEMEVTIGGPITGVTATVTFFKEGGKPETWHGNYGDGMAKLGKLGWELVASSARIEAGLGNKHKLNHLFKRELTEVK